MSAFHRPVGRLPDLIGKTLAGGCEDCVAFQAVDQVAPGIYGLTVRHDHTCPYLRAIVARREKEHKMTPTQALEAQQVAPVASPPSRPAYGAQAGAQTPGGW